MKTNFFFFFAGAPLALLANPQNFQVAAGTCEAIASEALLELKTSDRAVLNWDSFSIGAGEKTVFVQPGAQSAVLNRVVGAQLSSLLGTLESNGQVYLLNPNGVLVGKDAIVDTGSFIASTLDVPDQVFLAGGDLLFKGDSKAPITHLGTIRSLCGDIVLIARTVDNQGKIDAGAGFAGLAAGHEVLLRAVGEERLAVRAAALEGEREGTGIVSNGAIEALTAELKADGNLYSYAIRHEGLIDAKGAVKENGRVFLVAEKGLAEVSGTIRAESGEIRVLGDRVGLTDEALIDASGDFGGGKVCIGGDFQGNNPAVMNSRVTSLGASTRVKADARIAGHGGEIAVWSDGSTGFYGAISAEGGARGGDGGFIEVSGLRRLDYRGLSSALAPLGKTGTLLLDPTSITIVTPTQNATVASTIEPTIDAPPTSQVSPADVDTQLGLAHVIIQSRNTGPDAQGDVIVGEALSYTRANNLTLRTTNLTAPNVGDIIVNFTLENAGTGQIILQSSQDVLVRNIVQTASGDISVTAARHVEVGNGTVGGAIYSNSGAITVMTGSNLVVQGGSGASESSQIASDTMTNLLTFSIGGDLIVQGGTNTGTFAQIGSNTGGIAVNCPMTFRRVGGDVMVTGGTGGDNSYAIIGHGAQAAGVGNFSGYIDFNNLDNPAMFSVGGNFIVTGGGNANCFAQVGHVGSSVAASTLAGQVSIGTGGGSDQVAGYVQLQGGSGTDSSAVIGFGNYTSHPMDTYSGILSGSIFIKTSGSLSLGPNSFSILLQGGTSGTAPAVIGYLNSRTGGATTTITSGEIQLSAEQGILVEASQAAGEFSAIGYFSNGLSGPATVDIDLIDLSSLSNVYIGGRTDGAYGVIGAAAPGVAGSSCSTGVTIATAGQIILSNNFAIESYGAGMAADAHLGIFTATRESALPGTLQDITLSADQLKLVTGNLMGGMSNTCELYATQDLILNISTEINFNRDPLVPAEIESGPCYAIGRRDVNINTSAPMPGTSADMYVFGTNTLNPTLIGSDTLGTCGMLGFPCSSPSSVNIGSLLAYGVENLTIGVNTMTGCASIRSCGDATFNVGTHLTLGSSGMDGACEIHGNGVMTFITGGNLTVQGGTADFASARIHNETGNISFDVGSEATLLGGLGQLTFAQIDTYGNPMGNISFANIGGNLLLTGGEGDQAYAQIGENDSPNAINSAIVFDNIVGNVTLIGGAGFSEAYAVIGHGRKPNAANPTIMGSVVLDVVGGNVSLTGGSGTGAIAHIGHIGNQITPLSITGDTRVGSTSPIGGFLTIQGGNFASASAGIGIGDSLSHRGDTYSGAVDVQVDGVNGSGNSVEIVAGNVFPSAFLEAYIGFQTGNGPMGAFTGTITGTFLGLTADRSIYMAGGDGNAAFIGYYNDGANTTDASFGNIQVQTNDPLGDIELIPGDNTDGVAAIGLYVPAGILSTNVNITAGRDLILYGPGGGNTGSCRILNNRPGVSAAFDVSLSAQNIRVLGGAGSNISGSEVFSSQFLSLTAIDSIDINNDVALQDGFVSLLAESGLAFNPMGSAGTVTISGSGDAMSQTSIVSNGLGVFIGFMANGASDVAIGKSTMVGPVVMSANNGGDIQFNLTGNLSAAGGSGAAASVVMTADTNFGITAGGSIAFASGSGLASPVQAVSTMGAIAFNAGTNASFAGQAPVLIQITMGAGLLSLSAGTGQMTFSDTIVQHLGTGDILAVAGTNMSLSNVTQFSTVAGNIDLVMDNLFPMAPLFGFTSFSKDATSTIDAPGTVRIFTSARIFNSVSGSINMTPYAAGTEFDNSSLTEQWGFYYNTLYGGVPYTIFYKNTSPIVIPVPAGPEIPEAFYRGLYKILFIANNEPFQDWRVYDEYLYKTVDLGWRIDTAAYGKRALPPGSLSWVTETGNQTFQFLRRTPRNYHTKKLDPQ